MNAFAMIATSFESQWRGLTEGERVTLAAHWAVDTLLASSHLKALSVAKYDQPIWSAVNDKTGQCLALFSLKTDCYRDIPTDVQETP